MTMEQSAAGSIASDPYAELNDIHKLIETLRTERSELHAELESLRQSIDNHHKEVFK